MFLHPTRSLARDPRKLATRMTDEQKPTILPNPRRGRVAGWSPEPWIESGASRPWAHYSEVVTPAAAAPTQPLYDMAPPRAAASSAGAGAVACDLGSAAGACADPGRRLRWRTHPRGAQQCVTRAGRCFLFLRPIGLLQPRRPAGTGSGGDRRAERREVGRHRL